MAKAADIGWGSYSQYEGPFYRGKCKYHLPEPNDEGDRILRTITATEGGAYDAYNGYDKCICTSGLIQWCDRAPLFLVCRMLGAVADEDVAELAPIIERVNEWGYTFGRTAKGTWRFWRTSDGDEVNTQDKQRELYFGGASGRKGQWSAEQRQHAKTWAAACSTVWESPGAQKMQREYTATRLFGFATASAKRVLEAAAQHGGVHGEVFRAAYLSYAANNPKWASESLKYVVGTYGISWGLDWLITALKALTFRPGIAIYPHRYNAIRPVLEKMYGVDLPDFAKELKQWKVDNSFGGMLSTKDLQKSLLLLGFDLGPWRDDGVFGEKTRSALHDFEEQSGVPEDHQDGYPDKYTIPKLEEELKKRGEVLPWM
jgi:hypothetical protein